jgi:hypothetical protein
MDILKDNGGLRSGGDRRRRAFADYPNDRRSGQDRRDGLDRRRKPRPRYIQARERRLSFRVLSTGAFIRL